MSRIAILKHPGRFNCVSGQLDSECQGKGTLMRHFLYSTSPPGALAGSVPRGTTAAALVARCGATQRLDSAPRRTRPGAVPIAAVAGPADVHRLAAGRALVQPMGLPSGFIGHRHARSMKDWTTPCIARIKAMRRRSLMRAAALKARGSDQELARAFVICGEAASIANPATRSRGRTAAGPPTSVVGSHPAAHPHTRRASVITTTVRTQSSEGGGAAPPAPPQNR